MSPEKEAAMSDRVYKKVEIVGTSKKGFDDAVNNAIETAAKTIRNVDWFEVVETTGHVVDGKVAHFRSQLKSVSGSKKTDEKPYGAVRVNPGGANLYS
jgi:flavin-binding protein dodecin